MAEYHGKPYDPDHLCQDDYEWLTETGPYAHGRVARIRRGLNRLRLMIANAQEYTARSLAYARLVAPESLAVPALETVLEALDERAANVSIRLALLDAYPRIGYTLLTQNATLQMPPEHVQVCPGCPGRWCVGCVPDTDVLNEVKP
jgi:hypothetical protein